MIFGKHINRYYLRYLPVLLLGVAALVMVDIMQLAIPEFYRTVVNGLISGTAVFFGEYASEALPYGWKHTSADACLITARISHSSTIRSTRWAV